MIPILLSVGIAVDYVRLQKAHDHLQNVADAAALAAAASRESSYEGLKGVAERYYLANYVTELADDVTLTQFTADDKNVKVTLAGSLPMMFMNLVGIKRHDVSAVAAADRAIGNLEVSLVLDNTWSMSELDSKGVSKIAGLKSAALTLIDEVTKDGGSNVKMAVVPYADYVNVGVANRNKPWLDIPDDYSKAPAERVCKTLTTKSVCVSKSATYACTKVIDGVSEPATCGGSCLKYEDQTVPAYQSCTGGGNPTLYKWYGCIGSRKDSDSRLHDGAPTKKYPGYVDTSQKCLTPILPLTTKKADVVAAINGMIINISSYKPYTYIPAGVVWGLNTLSPTEPFAEGAAYDPRNRGPRKAMVLMTDGENTLRFSNTDGKHVAPNSNATKAAGELKKTNSDTTDICTYMKSKQIEIFSVAFMVDNADAKALLEGCATDGQHYFDASDSKKLKEAFQSIGQSLRLVRLTQ